MRASRGLSATLLVAAVATSCTSATPAGRTPAARDTPAPHTSGESPELVRAGGTASCHDGRGDLLTEASGDRTGPPARPPRRFQPGSDLTGVSMARDRSGMTINFGTDGRVPDDVRLRATLRYTFTASPIDGGRLVAAVTAILLHDRWMVEIRDGDRHRVLTGRPELAGEVLGLVIDEADLPELMRGPFRWGARSEWVPRQSPRSDRIFFDYCPDQGFPAFRGISA